MSTAVSLAAAKKRRSQPTFPTPNNNQKPNSANSCPRNGGNCNNTQNLKVQNSTTQNSNANYEDIIIRRTPIDAIKIHDYKIWCLEKKLEKNMNMNTEDFVTKRDIELLQLDSSNSSKTDNLTTNKVEQNCSEITSLKNTVSKLTKTINESQMLVQTLRATLLSQTEELNELKSFKTDFYKFLQETTNDNQEDIDSENLKLETVEATDLVESDTEEK